MIIPFVQTWCESLTPCPFSSDPNLRVGEYECEQCEHCFNRGSHSVICMHPEGDGKERITNKFRNRHIVVISRDINTERIDEENYYNITKGEALKRFISTHPNAFKSPERCKAFYWYQFEEIASHRNARLSKSSYTNARRSRK